MPTPDEHPWYELFWRPPRWLSWVGIAFSIVWTLTMLAWVEAGWGLWLMFAAGAFLVSLNGIIHPRPRQ